MLCVGWVLVQHTAAASKSDQLDSLFQSLEEGATSDSLRFYLLMEVARNYVFSEPLKSQAYFDSAQHIIGKQEESAEMQAYFNLQFGSFFWTQAMYEQALSRYSLAADYYIKTKDSLRISTVYNNIAEVYKKLGDYDQALSYHKALAQMHGSQKRDYRSALAYINLGELYMLMDEEDSATFYLKKGRDLARMNRNNRYMAYSFQYLGDIAFRKGFYMDALTNYQQSLVLWKARNDKRGQADIYNRLAEVAILQGDYPRANRYLVLAESIIIEDKLADLHLKTLKHYVSLHKGEGQYKKALEYHEQYSVLKDSIFSLEKRDQLLKLQLQMDLIDLEKSNFLLSKEKELADEKLKLQNNLILFVIICLFISVGFLYGMIIQKRLADKANRGLVQQKNQVEEQQREIVSQSNKLQQLNQQLSELNAVLEAKDITNAGEIDRQKKLIAEYAYMNAHKLRAPVASVIGLINIMELSKDGKVDTSVISHLKAAATELDEVVTNIRNTLSDNVDPDIASLSIKHEKNGGKV